jgi:hypothetical protein
MTEPSVQRRVKLFDTASFTVSTLYRCSKDKLEETPYSFAVVFFGSPFPVKYRFCSLSVALILEQPPERKQEKNKNKPNARALSNMYNTV